ncbi:P-loop containing nucleoside triphosphate hydrolase protein [Armillaria borealis]|uniref:ATP-dependent RNA helicase n=1 Tax=Armillaria borealis TaxID=47425 RepID=A0AA39J1R4_9AGAR|nr:P-loop containing nucleoside triphosphate hydrolase protein [Armillaria borealis]
MTVMQEEVLNDAKPYDPEFTSTRDLLIRECTGTGKTLAFLPIIEARVRLVFDDVLLSKLHRVSQVVKNWARAYVGAALRRSYNHEGFEVWLLVGGMNMSVQLRDWAKGRPDIVVATPGRIRDIALKTTRTLVLDEVDMLIGFCDDISANIRDLPPTPKHQTLSLCATLTLDIRLVACEALAKDYKYINCVDDSTPTHLNVPQYATTLKHLRNFKVVEFLPTIKLTKLFSSMLKPMAKAVFPAGKETWIGAIPNSPSGCAQRCLTLACVIQVGVPHSMWAIYSSCWSNEIPLSLNCICSLRNWPRRTIPTLSRTSATSWQLHHMVPVLEEIECAVNHL